VEEQIVWIGDAIIPKGGAEQGRQRPVRFHGEELAVAIVVGENNGAWQRKETLFRTGDGRLLVYVQDRSQAEGSACGLYEASPADLCRDGRFAGLGQGWWFLALPETGYASPEQAEGAP
jgi:hypothetical protein